MGSGCAQFYNTCKETEANTKMIRDFENDRAFSKSGEELPYKGGLMLTYKI